MNVDTIQKNGQSIAVVQSDEPVITDVQAALDFISTIFYETGCDRIALNKEAITEKFFILSSRLAGDVLQKFINYNIKFAVVGDFKQYTSKPLKEFIYESNRGRQIFFMERMDEAVEKLSLA